MTRHKVFILLAPPAYLASVWACTSLPVLATVSQAPPPSAEASPTPGREAAIPVSAVKMSPEADQHPPLVYSDEYDSPVPVPGAINTAGAEDSPFVTPDGNTLYFFFTPDVAVSPATQISDGVTGIYASTKVQGEWAPAQRVAGSWQAGPGRLRVRLP